MKVLKKEEEFKGENCVCFCVCLFVFVFKFQRRFCVVKLGKKTKREGEREEKRGQINIGSKT